MHFGLRRDGHILVFTLQKQWRMLKQFSLTATMVKITQYPQIGEGVSQSTPLPTVIKKIIKKNNPKD